MRHFTFMVVLLCAVELFSDISRSSFIRRVPLRSMNAGAPRCHPGSILFSTVAHDVHYGNLVHHLPAVLRPQYLFIPDANAALRYSTAATLLALFVFGWVKAMLIGSPKRGRSALETLAVGGAAAAAAYFLAKLFNVEL